MRVIKAFEDELRGLARHRKALRNRRPLREHAGKITRRPHGWKIDAAIVEKIGIDQPRDQAEWQIVAIDGMGGEQRPAGLELDRPEAVELDGGFSVGKRRIRKLRGGMKV